MTAEEKLNLLDSVVSDFLEWSSEEELKNGALAVLYNIITIIGFKGEVEA